jgi:hypothetical protein
LVDRSVAGLADASLKDRFEFGPKRRALLIMSQSVRVFLPTSYSNCLSTSLL